MYEKRHLSGKLKANPDGASAHPHVFEGHKKSFTSSFAFPVRRQTYWTPKTKQETVILFDLKVEESVRERGIELRRG